MQHEGGEGVVHKFYSFTKDADHFRLCYPGDDPPETVWVKEYPKATSQAVQAEFQALAQAPDEPLMIDGNDLGVNDAIMTLFGEATDNPRLIRDCPHTPRRAFPGTADPRGVASAAGASTRCN